MSVTALPALTIATVFGFIAYLHGVVQLMRVKYLLKPLPAKAGKPSRRTFHFPPLRSTRSRLHRVLHPAGCFTAEDRRRDGHRPAGPCRHVPTEGLLGRLYSAHATPFGLANRGAEDAGEVAKFFLICGEPTSVQDPAFGFGQLVDVGARAPSPAINDPTTAVQGIDRVGDLVAPVGTRPGQTGLRVDSTGAVRVKRQLRNFEALATLSCTEIIRYGADAPGS